MRIHHRWVRFAAGTFWLAAVIGCGSEIAEDPVAGEPSGYLQVEVATTGADPDLDGYWVSVRLSRRDQSS